VFGYLTGQELHDLPSTLYFAFQTVNPDYTQIRPYTYAAKVQSVEELTPSKKYPEFKKQKVIFTDIR
jgi:hypothetical protein